MDIHRRNLFTATAGLGLAATASNANAASAKSQRSTRFIDFGPSRRDVTARLQRAIDEAAKLGQAIHLSPGTYSLSGKLRLRPGTKLIGPHGLATISLTGSGAISADNAADLSLIGFTITGTSNTRGSGNSALLEFTNCANLNISDLVIQTAPNHAIKLWKSSGRIERCRLEQIGHTAIRSGNATGLTISDNRIRHAGNNGIVVWRDVAGNDGTSITNNDIAHIRTDAGGSGQNGNAINAFRADHVLITTNMIADCAYSAVRCNAASNAQIIANNCRQIGEVALYAEFGFEGAVIANNIVDHAATGIEVTNFKEGGRLATVQGNIIRNLVRREHEPVDKRGTGISVEADTIISGNTIENAPTSGISIGWGKWMRHVAATGNLVRDAHIGFAVSAKGKPGTVLIANNIISETKNGAVRLFDHSKLLGPDLHGETVSNSPAILNSNLIS